MDPSSNSGQSENGGRSSKLIRKRYVYGVLNAVILMPVKVAEEITDPIWSYLQLALQIYGYAIGAGKTTNTNIGIALYALATLQVSALFLRPNKDHKYRRWWNIFHRSLGYIALILSIANFVKGMKMMKPDNKWKNRAYVGGFASLLLIIVPLEVCSWIIEWRRKKSSNGGKANGH